MKKIIIYGLGAIGSNLLVSLSRQYPDFEFTGVDFDKIEERNLRTQAYFVEQVGQPKVMAMRGVLARYNRRPNYKPLNHRVVQQVSAEAYDLSIDCFDNSASRKFLKVSKGNMLHVGFSPFYTAEAIWNENYDVPGDVDAARADICSMQDAVPFIHYVVNAAALSISEWVQTGNKRDFLVTGKSNLKYL